MNTLLNKGKLASLKGPLKAIFRGTRIEQPIVHICPIMGCVSIGTRDVYDFHYFAELRGIRDASGYEFSSAWFYADYEPRQQSDYRVESGNAD